VAVSKLLSFLTKGSASNVLKAIGYLGICVGALLLATGVVVFLGETWSWDVWGLLVATGLGLVLRPLSRIPFSALLGLVAGLVCAGLLYVCFVFMDLFGRVSCSGFDCLPDFQVCGGFGEAIWDDFGFLARAGCLRLLVHCSRNSNAA
jgi:hypothetical protein